MPGIGLPCGHVVGMPSISASRSSTRGESACSRRCASSWASVQFSPSVSVSQRSSSRWRRAMTSAICRPLRGEDQLLAPADLDVAAAAQALDGLGHGRGRDAHVLGQPRADDRLAAAGQIVDRGQVVLDRGGGGPARRWPPLFFRIDDFAILGLPNAPVWFDSSSSIPEKGTLMRRTSLHARGWRPRSGPSLALVAAARPVPRRPGPRGRRLLRPALRPGGGLRGLHQEDRHHREDADRADRRAVRAPQGRGRADAGRRPPHRRRRQPLERRPAPGCSPRSTRPS